jgi:eukaryotic-like serine/threonine-protein kinase
VTLAPGTRLGPYTIVSALGAGGMGEVYRARDSRLDRDVAIKILPAAFALDTERLARFEREAKTLASLNHPHIAHIHGLEESGGVQALVMELVEGEDLSVRIARGPVPIEDALPIARQIADALDAAHARGIIHRDLKPANVKVCDDGSVKVLDFGLAKALEKDPLGGDAINSPTITSPATQLGVILGTAAYMAPEQAKGRAVDRRADVWAFGVVLLEMLTGRRAFPGDDISDVLASVLKDAPPLDALPPGTPPAIRRLLKRCLEKDRAKRLDSMADARLEIDDALAAPAADAVPARPVAANRGLSLLPWAIAAIATVIAIVTVTMGRRAATPADTPALYATLDAPPGYVLGDDDSITSLPIRTPIVFTPDGRSLILLAARGGETQLFVRPLDQPDARPIAGTEGAHVPFVSPDGHWVGFWSANELRKVPIGGGTVTTICAQPSPLGPNGAAWSTNGVIVYGDEVSSRLMRVPAGGGTPEPVTTTGVGVGRTRRHVTPSFLPDGRVLFSSVSTIALGDTRLMVTRLEGGEPAPVMDDATDARLLPSGQLAFMRLGTLMTVPFDAAAAKPLGTPAAAMRGVMQSGLRGRSGATNSGAGMYAVSSLGTLAAIRGEVLGADPSVIARVGPGSTLTPAEPTTGAPTGGRLWIRLSPDGTRAAVRLTTPVGYELWIADWSRNVWTRCADCPTGFGPAIWSVDSRRLVISAGDRLIARALDGSSPEQVLVKEDGHAVTPSAWLGDGRLVYLSTVDAVQFEIKVLDAGAAAGRVFLPLGTGSDPELSPDSTWMAYTSAKTGTREIFVQAFPGPGSRTQVSAGGGRNAMWSKDGRTIYYIDSPPAGQIGSKILAVDVTVANGGIRAGTPRQVLELADGQGCLYTRCYDTTPKGELLMRRRNVALRRTVSRFDLVQNWLRRLDTAR